MLHFCYLVHPLKARPFILRCATILLILVFSQKSGAGLFFHNLFHTGNSAKEAPGKQHDNSKELSYVCTCIDDFLMPFDGTDAPVFTEPVLAFAIPHSFFKDNIPFHTRIFSSLRGPPAFIM